MSDYAIIMDKSYIGYPFYVSKGCTVIPPYSTMNNKFVRKIRSILFKFICNWTIGINKRLKEDYGTYILYDSVSPVIANRLRRMHPDARIIIYFINPISKSYDIKNYYSANCEIWSFDEQDCKNYNLRWNPLHYFGVQKDTEHKKNYDVSFIGADKGRYKFLSELEETLKALGLKTNFRIMSTSDFIIYNKRKYNKRIPYKENIDYVLQSKAIVDIMQDGQTGFTMRIPEALVNHVKLITNNTSIKDYDFYSRKNCFILGEDSIDTICSFINSDWDYSKDKRIKELEFESWIKRFKIN